MIALCGFFKTLLMRTKVIFGWPSGSIDSLKLLVLLISAPVSGRNSGQRKGLANHSGVWKVWSAAEITPSSLTGRSVNIVVNRQFAGPDFGGPISKVRALQTNQFKFVGFG